MRQRRSGSEAYSGENGCHSIVAEKLPGRVLPEEPDEGMPARQNDRARVGLGDDGRPAVGQGAHPQRAAEEHRSIDFHATVDVDAAAVRIKAPGPVAAIVLVDADEDPLPE